jgi:hypothetical protein
MGDFAFCHWGEAMILAFASRTKTFETRRNGGNGEFENLFLMDCFGPSLLHVSEVSRIHRG